MIAKLSGIVDSIFETSIIIDVFGIGYLVFVPSSIITSIHTKSSISLYTETIVREDSITLYGFNSINEKNLFNLLMTVQGIGAKASLSIMSSIPYDTINNAILAGDYKPFTNANGIGKKTAERIVQELKDKIAKLDLAPQIKSTIKNIENDMVAEDTISALTNLGYSRTQVFPIVLKEIEQNPMISTQNLIKLVLKSINNF